MARLTGSSLLVLVSADARLTAVTRSAADDAGMAVKAVASVQAAIEVIGLPVSTGTAVLVDVDHAGLDTLDFIRLALPDDGLAAVGVAYGDGNELLAAQAVQLGAVCCLVKPVAMQHIRQALSRLQTSIAAPSIVEGTAVVSTTNLRALVESCAQALRIVEVRERKRHGGSFSIDARAEDVSVYVPTSAMANALVAVSLNAVEAMRGSDHGWIRLRAGRTKDRAYIAVTDNGPGIEQEYLGRVFEPFYTTRAYRGALGIGLTNAREDLRCYGGDLSIRSVIGKGVTVLFEAPAVTGLLTAERQEAGAWSTWDRFIRSALDADSDSANR